MPRIPLTRQAQVQEQAFQSRGVRAKAPKIVSNQGALQQAGQLLSKVNQLAEKEKAKAWDSTYKETENTLRNRFNEEIHNPTTGFKHIKGKNTAEQFKEREEEYQKFADDVIAKIGDEALKNRIQVELGDRYKGKFKNALNMHTGREMENHYDQVAQDTINSIHRDAVQNYNEALITNKPTESAAKLSAEIERYGLNRGMDSKSVEEMKLKATDQMHKQVLLAGIDDEKTDLAKDYLARNKKQMMPETVRNVKKLLKRSSTLGESQKMASEQMVAEVSLEEGLRNIRAKTDAKPELQQAAVREYKNRYNESKAIQETKRIEYFEGRGDDIYTDPVGFKLTSNDLATLTLTEQDRLSRHKANRLKELRGEGVKTDWAAYQKLSNMNSEELARTNLVQDYSGKLAPAQLKQFIDQRAKQGKDYTTFRTKNQTIQALVNRAINKGWIIDEDPSDKDIDYITALYENEINKLPVEKRNSIEEQNKVIDLLTLQMETPGANVQMWQAKKEGKSFTAPDDSVERPASVPKNSTWKVIRVNGVTYQGWEGMPDPDTGEKVLYGQDGKALLRAKVK